MVALFISYSHKDDDLRNELDTHLAMLKREGKIDVWHDRRITAGDDIDHVVSDALENAQIILLLVSPDFLASSYCYDRELRRAMERHAAGEARVIPVILRSCDWTRAPFGKLRATPTDGKPIRKWPDIDEAFLHVVEDIRRAVDALPEAGHIDAIEKKEVTVANVKRGAIDREARSSNLRIRKEFTESEKDRFLDEAFEYIAKFFEGSLGELEKRYSGIETAYKKIDARKFTAVVYRNGKSRSRCRIMMAGHHAEGIIYSNNDTADDNSFNESLSVVEGTQMLYLKPLGMNRWSGREKEPHLTFEGAAEYLWAMLIEPLQQ